MCENMSGIVIGAKAKWLAMASAVPPNWLGPCLQWMLKLRIRTCVVGFVRISEMLRIWIPSEVTRFSIRALFRDQPLQFTVAILQFIEKEGGEGGKEGH